MNENVNLQTSKTPWNSQEQKGQIRKRLETPRQFSNKILWTTEDKLVKLLKEGN